MPARGERQSPSGRGSDPKNDWSRRAVAGTAGRGGGCEEGEKPRGRQHRKAARRARRCRDQLRCHEGGTGESHPAATRRSRRHPDAFVSAPAMTGVLSVASALLGTQAREHERGQQGHTNDKSRKPKPSFRPKSHLCLNPTTGVTSTSTSPSNERPYRCARLSAEASPPISWWRFGRCGPSATLPRPASRLPRACPL